MSCSQFFRILHPAAMVNLADGLQLCRQLLAVTLGGITAATQKVGQVSTGTTPPSLARYAASQLLRGFVSHLTRPLA